MQQIKEIKEDWLSKDFREHAIKGRLPRNIMLSEKNTRRLIPKGCYCYDENGVCPFWWSFDDFGEQMNGYCSLMERGDWMQSENGGTSLLFDQCKECGLNDDDDSLYDPVGSANIHNCPECKKSVEAFVINVSDGNTIFECPACGHKWSKIK